MLKQFCLNKKIFVWMIAGGLIAYPIEGLFRLFSPSGNGGWVSIFMFPIYAMCLLGVGILNQRQWFYERPMVIQALIGALTILAIEYTSGIIINVWLSLAIWDYSNLRFSDPHGQISLLFGIFWFLLMPFTIWFEDRVSFVYDKAMDRPTQWNYTLLQAYKELFTGK